ncbi:MAG: non-homologous end-joining DNA ligase, partial [Rhodothermaceae bacterium]|nr:non-homologous end-joining DNA ligase [Rhodothermaceae bacterium]
MKAAKSEKMVIGGYTKNDGSSKSFSSLLLGVYDKGKLIYKGKAGTGFSDKQQREMIRQFKPYIIKMPPFAEQPDINKASRFQPDPPHATAVWMKPELVCEVSFTEITTDGIMRHPSFIAMRTGIKAKDVTTEKAFDASETTSKKKAKSETTAKPARTKDRKPFLNPADKTQVRKINGHEIKFTNLNKIYWPKENITKRDLLSYYHQVAPWILPYLKNRPQSMNRHPDGINGESFYFKNVTGTAPHWVETYTYKSDADAGLKKYLVAKDEASLLYMATLGCIEMNPWHSRVEKEEYPDWCIIDLDPAQNTFDQVIEAAIVTRQILESLGVTSYPKTSGSTGIHVYIPMGAKYTYEQSKEFARIIATLVQRELPKFTSIERSVKARKGKIYIDFLQNRPHATVAAPYSLRPKPGATVSMPLHWDEVKKGLKMSDFTIYNALDRIKS